MYFRQKDSTTSDINRLQRENEDLQRELNAKDKRLKYLEEQVQVQNQLKERLQKIKTQNIKHKKKTLTVKICKLWIYSNSS